MRIKIAYALFAIGVLWLVAPMVAKAAQITEIAYDVEGSDDKREWIELHNNGNDPLSLEGWSLTVGEESSRHALSFALEKGGRGEPIIPAGGYSIIASDAAIFVAEYITYTGPVADSVISLPNYSATRTESIVIRFYDKDGVERIAATYLPEHGIATGKTIEWIDGIWRASLAGGGSPGMSPPAASPLTPTSIRVVAILPNPEGSDANNEWVELENYGESVAILDNWYITDKPTASGSFHKEVVPAGTAIVVGGRYRMMLSGSFLNNSDEIISLYRSDDSRVEEITVEGSAPEGIAYHRAGALWQWENTISPSPQPLGTATGQIGAQKSPSSKSSTASPLGTSNSKSSPKASVAGSVSTKKVPTPKVTSTKKSSPSPTLPTVTSAVAGITAGPPTIQLSSRAQWGVGVVLGLLIVSVILYRFQLHRRLLDRVRYGILKRK
jgi:hypothetical protein